MGAVIVWGAVVQKALKDKISILGKSIFRNFLKIETHFPYTNILAGDGGVTSGDGGKLNA